MSHKPFVDRICAAYDHTQREAIEACATLATSPAQTDTHFAAVRAHEAALRANGGAGANAPPGPPQPGVLPIVLIQGPPGTGKTHTVKAVLNTWHLSQYQRYSRYFEQQLADALQATKGPSGHKSAAARASPLEGAAPPPRDPRPRILVCAPSNAATDELLSRVLRDQFADVHGQLYTPHVARVGSDAALGQSELQAVRPSLRSADCFVPLYAWQSVQSHLRCSSADMHSTRDRCAGVLAPRIVWRCC